MNFKTLSTDEIKRRLKFHENDNGTMTMRQEMARMWYIQEYMRELKERRIEVA